MLVKNKHQDWRTPLQPEDAAMVNEAAAQAATELMSVYGGYAPSPLLSLPTLAEELGVGSIAVKDESGRMGLGSFKALGGAFAVLVLALEEAGRRLGRSLRPSDIHQADAKAALGDMTFACATDGNHGRSVAWGAAQLGLSSVIFVHEGVSDVRAAEIERFGARIVRVAGTYDDSVAEAERVAAEQGWCLVSDTSWPGYERIPGLIMQGYTVLVKEALAQMPAPPTHVFVQAGVGGLAAAVAGYLDQVYGKDRPFFIVVEPSRAACLQASIIAGELRKIPPHGPTVMAMLECYEPSLTAWRILTRTADAFMTVNEGDAVSVMNRLARPAPGDPPIVAGESGGVGVAAVIKAAKDPVKRSELGLSHTSRIFVINTEGATDPDLYRELTGLDPNAVVNRTV